MLGACKFLFHKKQGLYGLSAKKFNLAPYVLMLLLMLPLIVVASTQPDFLASYPKMKNILPLPPDADPAWFYKLLFQLSYGSDFFSVEIFFRGFLGYWFFKMGRQRRHPAHGMFLLHYSFWETIGRMYQLLFWRHAVGNYFIQY